MCGQKSQKCLQCIAVRIHAPQPLHISNKCPTKSASSNAKNKLPHPSWSTKPHQNSSASSINPVCALYLHSSSKETTTNGWQAKPQISSPTLCLHSQLSKNISPAQASFNSSHVLSLIDGQGLFPMMRVLIIMRRADGDRTRSLA